VPILRVVFQAVLRWAVGSFWASYRFTEREGAETLGIVCLFQRGPARGFFGCFSGTPAGPRSGVSSRVFTGTSFGYVEDDPHVTSGSKTMKVLSSLCIVLIVLAVVSGCGGDNGPKPEKRNMEVHIDHQGTDPDG
jgi:hypothetical protein